MSMIRQVTIYLFLLTLAVSAKSQDVTFSQFYAAPLHLNPAFAGVTSGPRITLNYRDQWPNWPSAFRTFAATYEQPLEELNSGLGLILMTDDAGNGIYKTNFISGTYSYQLNIQNEVFIKIGLQAGVIQTRLDWDQLIFVDQLDPLNGAQTPGGNPIVSEEIRPENLTESTLDFSTGLLVYGGNFYGGITIKHLTQSNTPFLDANQQIQDGFPTLYSFHGGAEINLPGGNIRNGPTFISPNVLFQQQGDFTQLNLGAYAGYGQVFGGLWYRHTFENPDAVIGLMGVRYGVLRIGYSYDATISNLSTTQPGGTHEISIAINLGDSKQLNRKKRQSRYSNCFKMFN